MKDKKIILLLILLSFLLITPSVKALSGEVSISGEENYDYVKEVTSIMNEERAKEELSPLTLDESLTEKAMIRAKEIAYSFSHTRPNNTSCFTVLEGLQFTAVGENIAYGQKSPSAVMKSWMDSTDHKNNIMAKTDSSKKFQAVGIGHTTINGVNYWVQLFSDHVTKELTKTGTETVQSKVNVVIPEDEELDFSPSMKISFNDGVHLKKNELDTYQIFTEHQPIIKKNGWNVSLKESDVSYKSNDENIVFVGAYGDLMAKKDGTTTVTVTMDKRVYNMPVTVEGFTSDEKEYIDKLEIKNATLEFKAGDKPVFTGETAGEKYTIVEEWWEEENSTSNNEVEVFEEGKKYSYHASFEVNPSCGYNCYIKDSAQVIINGKDYGMIKGTDADGKTFTIINDTYILEIPKIESTDDKILKEFEVYNATLDLEYNDNVIFTGKTDSKIYDIIEYWAFDGEVFEDMIPLNSQKIKPGDNTEHKFYENSRYYYYVAIKIKEEYKDQYLFPEEGTKVSLMLNGKKYDDVDWYIYNGKLFLMDLLYKETMSPEKTIKIIDQVELNNATLNFQAGDKPVFTGEWSNENYSVLEAWIEYYRYIDNTGGLTKRATSSEEENEWLKDYDGLLEKMEPAKRYLYNVEFVSNYDAQKDTDTIYLFPARGEIITVIINGKKYEVKSTYDFYLPFDNEIYIDIPYMVENATIDFKEGDKPVFTGNYDTENYQIIETWTEYTKEEGHEYDDNFWSRKGISSDSELSDMFLSSIDKFEAGKKYSYSIRFDVNSNDGEGREYYLQKGQEVKILINGKEYTYVLPDDSLIWGVKDLFTIEIPSKEIPITNIELSKSEVTLTEGETETVIGKVLPENTTEEKTITWTSSNEEIATVENGVITAIQEGEATITAKVGEKTSNVKVTVKKKVIPITEIQTSKKEYVLTEGEQESLELKVLPENHTVSGAYTIEIEDESIASVNSVGYIEAKKEGTTTITISVGEVSTTVKVTVKKKVIPITNLELNKSEVTLIEGETETVTGKVLPENTTEEKTITWTSSNEAIATVENGVITAIQEGEATITAKVGEKTSTVKVTVKKKVIPITNIELSKSEVTLIEGETETVTGKVLPENTTEEKTITWTSSNDEIATVENGVITAIQEGEATITAKVGEKTSTVKVTVKKKVIPITNLELSKSEVTLIEGETETITGKVLPENTTEEKTITWTSSNEAIATVENGIITAIQEGEATITAKVGEKSSTVKVTVKKKVIPITEIQTSKKEYVLTEGEQESLELKVLPENHTVSGAYTIEIEDESIASVNSVGYIEAKKEGTTAITISVGEVSTTVKVTVKKKVIPITNIELSKSEVTLIEGETETITGKVLPENTTEEKTITWTSSNDEIVTVENGVITAIKEGYATVTATINSVTKEIQVIVNKKPVPITKITLEEHEKAISSIDYLLINTYEPMDAQLNLDFVKWSSSNEKVLIVTSEGKIVPVQEGEAIVTAAYGDVSDTCHVRVVKSTNDLLGFIKDQSQKYYNDNTKIVMVNNKDNVSLELLPELEDIFKYSENPEEIVWTSSNNDIVSIDQEGNISFNKVGEAYITANFGMYKTAKLRYKVYDVELDYKDSLYIGEEETITLKFLYQNSKYRDVSWSVDNPSIATIDENGVLKANEKGTVYVTGKYPYESTIKYTFAVNIKERDKNIFQVYFDEESKSIIVENSNGRAILVIDDITDEIEKEDMPKKEDEEFIELFDIYYKLGSNSTFENPIYIVRVPINFNLEEYEKISVVYLKDGEIKEELDYKIIEDKYIEFTTTHFSKYAIYGKKKPISKTNTIIKEYESIPNTGIDNKNSISSYLLILLGWLLSVTYYRKNLLEK